MCGAALTVLYRIQVEEKCISCGHKGLSFYTMQASAQYTIVAHTLMGAHAVVTLYLADSGAPTLPPTAAVRRRRADCVLRVPKVQVSTRFPAQHAPSRSKSCTGCLTTSPLSSRRCPECAGTNGQSTRNARWYRNCCSGFSRERLPSAAKTIFHDEFSRPVCPPRRPNPRLLLLWLQRHVAPPNVLASPAKEIRVLETVHKCSGDAARARRV